MVKTIPVARAAAVASAKSVCQVPLYRGRALNGTLRQFASLLDSKAEKQDVERILGALDALAKRQEIDDEERLVMAHQLERLDQWVHQLASKIGVELSQ